MHQFWERVGTNFGQKYMGQVWGSVGSMLGECMSTFGGVSRWFWTKARVDCLFVVFEIYVRYMQGVKVLILGGVLV